MYAIMTVTGADSTGIIAAVTTTLAELDINVIDVSQ
ncbi:ACT domain-containing protein, partial [Streptococcus pseudopneumoniae]